MTELIANGKRFHRFRVGKYAIMKALTKFTGDHLVKIVADANGVHLKKMLYSRRPRARFAMCYYCKMVGTDIQEWIPVWLLRPKPSRRGAYFLQKKFKPKKMPQPSEQPAHQLDRWLNLAQLNPLSAHLLWCMVCGENGNTPLIKCSGCVGAFHEACCDTWPDIMEHRINKAPQAMALALKGHRESAAPESRKCPQCLLGPELGQNDVVWTKVDEFTWWPARIVGSRCLPACLWSVPHHSAALPLFYSGDGGEPQWKAKSAVCMFVPGPAAANVLPTNARSSAYVDAVGDYREQNTPGP